MANTRDVLTLARNLCDAYIPEKNVRLVLNGTKKVLGQAVQTYGGQSEIRLSKHWIKALPLSEYENTIRHEIAHIKAGVENGHNHIWRAACEVVGARPERCNKVASTANIDWKYTLHCPKCNEEVGHRTRKPKGIYVCTTCHSVVKIIQNY